MNTDSGKTILFSPQFVFRDEDKNTPNKDKVYTEKTSYVDSPKNVKKGKDDPQLKNIELLNHLHLFQHWCVLCLPTVKCPQISSFFGAPDPPSIFPISSNSTSIPTTATIFVQS